MDKRKWVQALWAFTTNAHIQGFLTGKIYKGKLKNMCVPGLNCYSCPGALGSCPIGAMQSVAGTTPYGISMYVLGFLVFVGIMVGRVVCGWLCPFGLIQELFYKIPIPKIRMPKKLNNILGYIKYIMLIGFVILLPILTVDQFGIATPYFCKLVCPAGTLEGGIPLLLTNPSLRGAIGGLFTWKMFILVAVIIGSIIIFRFFCRYLCPLGAFYSLLNPISFYKYRIDEGKCTKCGICSNKCKMDIDVYQNPNSRECIRCGECIKACPHGAIKGGIKEKKGGNIK